MTSPIPRNKRRAAAFAAAVATMTAGTALWPAAAHAMPYDWYQATGPGPSAARGAAMAYDAATGNVVLFGGDGSAGHSGQTWIWEGFGWTRAFPTTSPAARVDASMAYDTTTHQLVLFGGFRGPEGGTQTPLSDTWIWDGSDWVQQSPTHAPPARWSGALTDDPATGQLVLFGGFDGAAYAGDTWEWDGSDWAQQSPAHSPTPRTTAIAYNGVDQNVVLFGGFDGAAYAGDTWEWDGSDWAQQSPAHSPDPRAGFTLAYHGSAGLDLLFGGGDGTLDPTDTWFWDGSDWWQLPTGHVPAGRTGAVSTFDGHSGELVLFGGLSGPTVLGDTWVYGFPPPPPPATPPAAPAPQVSRLQGTDRDATAIAVSNAGFPAAGSAHAVVLARDEVFPDSLVGAPLSAHAGGPLLLTPSDALDATVAAEIRRVLPAGGTVYLLGGPVALSAAVAETVEAGGYVVKRIGGADRYTTAIAVAAALGNPDTTFVATASDYPDALAAGPAAALTGGAVVLSDGTRLTPSTADYLRARHGAQYAIGGLACQAAPVATCIAGEDRYATAAAVASKFAPHPGIIGVASGAAFPDAAAGGAYVADRGGALLLAPPVGPLPAAVVDYLASSGTLVTVVVGGATALPASVEDELSAALG
jgi:putative cell wall-binding protein